MLIEDFVDVGCGIDVVRERCVGRDDWMSPLADAAEADGATLLMRIGPASAPGALRRSVRAAFGGWRERDESTLVAWLTWEAVELRSLFPVLDGDLEISPIGPDQCRLTLSASYLPPFGVVGRGVDWALMHRVAQSTVRSFLRRLAASVEGFAVEAGTPEVSR